MNWDCTDTEERLSDFLEEALSQEESAAFSTHAAGCAKCAQLVAQVGGLVQRMQRTQPVEMPAQLVSKILDATLGPRQTQRGWKWWFAWVPTIWQPRFAMSVLTVAASFAIVMHATGVSPAAIGQAELNPMNVARAANRQAHLTYGHAMKFVDDLQLVYEIRSQLEPETPPQSEPAPEPAPQTSPETAPGQQTQPQPQNGQPRSEAKPPSGTERSRAEKHDGPLLAFVIGNSATSFSVNGSSR
jgi:hypothetical protein